MKKIVFDIETKYNTFDVILICVYDGHNGKTFYDLKSFLKYMFQEYGNENVSIYAHYAGAFDFLFLMQHVRDTEIKIENFLEANGLIFYLRLNYYGLTLDFKDSYALFHCGLNEVSKNLLGQEKDEIDIINIEHESFEKVEEYCLKDCKLLFNCLEVFEHELDESLKLTISMQAVWSWKSKFTDHNFPKYNKFFLDTFRSFYFGGHVDVYKRYGEKLFCYDINNAYGYSMKEYGGIYGSPCFSDHYVPGMNGIWNIKLETKSQYPHLAKPYDGKLYFLNSSTELFQVTTLDLIFLERNNINYKVENGWVFKYDKNMFEDYVTHWHNKRFKSKKLKFISKLMINSLYGKFGQKDERISAMVGDNLEYYYDKKTNIGRRKTQQYSWFMQPQLAAWITSAARVLLHSYLYDYKDHVYYCDTDSLFLDCELDPIDQHNRKLGKMKLEYRIDKAYFLSSKFYGMKLSDGEFISKLKGFGTNFNESQFERALKGDLTFEWNYQKISKFKSALMSTGDFLNFKKIDKKINQLSLKRKLLNDGINTDPYTLTNGELK